MAKKEKDTKLLFGSVSAGSGYSLMILAYVVISLLGATILNELKLEQGSVEFIAISSLFSIIAMLALILYYGLGRKENLLKTCTVKGFSLKYIPLIVLLSAGMFLGFGFLNDLVAKGVVALGGKVNSLELPLENVRHLFLYILVLGVLPAVFEEAFFRGFMLSSLLGMKNVWKVIVVGLCFALFHGQISQFFYQFIFGALLCVLTLLTDSVLPAVIVHFINNLVVILFGYFKIEIDFTAWYIIVIGLALLALFSYLVYVFVKSKPKTLEYDGIDEDMKKQLNKNSHKAFWLPYGIFGCLICVALIVANVLM